MEKTKLGDLTVNDGKGLLDSDGLMQSLLIDCNNAVKMIVSGQYIAFCNTISEMGQKITALRDGYNKEIANRDTQIEELKAYNNELYQRCTGISVEEGTAPKEEIEDE